MSTTTLEELINQAGSPVKLLRESRAGAFQFPIPAEYSNWRDEQRAWTTGAVLFDMGHHMLDIYLKGPDVMALLSRVGVNTFSNFGKGRAKQLVAVNPDGYVIGDAIAFGLEDDEVNVVGTPTLPEWLAFQAVTGGYDVTFTMDPPTPFNPAGKRIFRYQLQGPNSLRIIEKAIGGPLPEIKTFQIGEFTIAGHPVRALNHSMSRKTGLEVWGEAADGPEVLAALLAAGEGLGLRQGGGTALPTTAIESGWVALQVPAVYTGEAMKPFREFLDAHSYEAHASLGGSFDSTDIEDYYVTPWDVGFGPLVKFDHDFIGREALETMVDQPHKRRVWLRWNAEDVERVFASSLLEPGLGAKFLGIPHSTYSSFQADSVLIDGDRVGMSVMAGYTVNVGGWFSVALIDERVAVDGAEVTVVWGETEGAFQKSAVEQHVQTSVRATISTAPLV